MARKKPESMLTRQRRLLKEQKARKAAKEAAKAKATKSLPSKGNTGGNSLKSRADRKVRAQRVAGQQQRVISEAMRKTMKQRAASDKAEKAAKGTKGSGVKTGTRTKGGPLTRQGSSAATRSSSGSPTSQRVQKVKVKVQPQKALPPSTPSGQRALPPSKPGGAITTTRGPRRRNVNTNPSSNTTRTGSRSAAYAQREVDATRRAGTQSRRPSKRGGLLAPLAAGAAVGAWMTNNLPRTATPSGRGSGRATDRVKPGPPKKDEKKTNNSAAINARLKKEAAARAAALARTNGNNNSQILRDAPGKGDPKPAPPKTTPTKPTPTRTPTATTPTKPARKPQSKDMDANYRAWAKANPKLAKKIKKGQAGYKAINGTPNKDSIKPKKRTWLADNYKPNKKKK